MLVSSFFLELPRVALPGPRAAPLIGSRVNLMRFFADPVRAMLRLHRDYGEIAAISRDDPGWVLAFGAAFNQQVLSDINGFHNFAESPLPAPVGSGAHLLGLNLMAQNGELYRRNRRLMMPPFTRDKLPDYGEAMVEVARRRLEAWPRRGIVDVRQEMVLLSLQVAMTCLFGIDLQNRDAQEFARLCLRYLGLVFSPTALLFPVPLPGTPYRRYLDTCDELARQLRLLILRKREEGMGKDVLSALILASDEDPEGMTEDELIGQLDLLLIASHETTAMTLAWSLLLLAAHPSWQEAVADEVAGALRGAAPTVADLPRMPLLGRVVDETLRLLPPTPLLFFRRGTRDFELAGRKLPAGSTLVLSPLLTHRQAALYPDANRFEPERWEGLSPGPYGYLPFGAGPRRCLGAGFAAQAIRLVLALVLQQRRVTVPGGVRVNYKVTGVVMGPAQGPRLQLSPPGAAIAPPQPVGGSVRELVDFA